MNSEREIVKPCETTFFFNYLFTKNMRAGRSASNCILGLWRFTLNIEKNEIGKASSTFNDLTEVPTNDELIPLQT